MAQDLSGNSEESTAIEAVRPRQVISDDALSGIKTYEDAWAAAEAAGGAVEDWSDYGTGFEVVDNKDELVGKPFVIAEWRFNSGDFGSFVSMALVTKDGRKLILNDGSKESGIRAQMETVTAKRRERGVAPEALQVGLVCERGLRRSDYTVDLPDRKTGEMVPTPASTYYLA